MLRFPNPGSTTDNFVAVYCAAYTHLNGAVVDLDDLVSAVVDSNLATSSGHMGAEAIKRSTRKDRSRDGLYNQLKMYAELFRSLGWLKSTEKDALKYTFTLLGEQLVSAGRSWRPLLGEGLIGIAYPNQVISVKNSQQIRPFATILRVMLKSDNCISRDEMIIGPLSIASDREPSVVETLAKRIFSLRASSQRVEAELAKLSEERGTQINTLKNYTRWPIATMRDLGWTQKVSIRFREQKKSLQVHRLTELGLKKAKEVAELDDLRPEQVDALPFEQKRAVAQYSHYGMMARAGFDISSIKNELKDDSGHYRSALKSLGMKNTCFDLFREVTTSTAGRFIFSPFQSLSTTDLDKIFPRATAEAAKISTTRSGDISLPKEGRDHLFVSPSFVVQERRNADSLVTNLEEELSDLLRTSATLSDASFAFAHNHENDKQSSFYPLVASLFRLLGFSCECSRAGVNYQRWDAYVTLSGIALPIEIKSPTEEVHLSTKAVRQAIENKVVLLARKGLNTRKEYSTLIVGYKIPRERGDMSALIDDVYKTYGINIGVVDLATLGYLGLKSICENFSIKEDQLINLRGFLSV